MTDAPPAIRANFEVGDQRTASRIVDLMSEAIDSDSGIAIAAFEQSGGRWDITLHFAQAPDEAAIRAMVALASSEELAQTLTFDTVAAKDWVKASLAGLVPVHAGRFVVHGRHDRARVPPNKIGIEIEAALAFGTGHHGTTRGCLLLLDRVLCRTAPQRVLDLGSGTGVLAIAAAKALHRPVLASDIDPTSVDVARENAQLNGAGHLVETICATGFASPAFRARGPFDLVLANILAAPLRQLAPKMARHLEPAAFVILSGLLPPQASSIVAAYRANGVKLLRRIEIENWTSLLMQRVS